MYVKVVPFLVKMRYIYIKKARVLNLGIPNFIEYPTPTPQAPGVSGEALIGGQIFRGIDGKTDLRVAISTCPSLT